MKPLLRVENLHKYYQEGPHTIHAVNGISFELYPGESLGLVGESGCGKSTTARCILRLEEVTEGRIFFKDQEISAIPTSRLRSWRQHAQMVFQDPNESLNPRFTVRKTLHEPLYLHGLWQEEAQLLEALARVNLEAEHLDRYPHQLSGGQKQRVGIARAAMTAPEFIILDEPTSSLDMSLRINVLSLLRRLQMEMNIAYLFISHDLSTVRHLCDRVLVMYLGQVVEMGRTDDVFANPQHVYTQALLSAIPIPDPTVKKERILLKGETPNLRKIKAGCGLQDRCPFVEAGCRQPVPFFDLGRGHQVACILAKGKQTIPNPSIGMEAENE